MRIPWAARKTNQEVLQLAKVKRSLVDTVSQRQLKFPGHVVRHKKTEHLSLTGKFNGTRGSRRPRLMFIDNFKHYGADYKPLKLITGAEDRSWLRSITADVCKETAQ